MSETEIQCTPEAGLPKLKFVSWNVNGLRAVVAKGFADIFSELDADFFCLQETKLSPGVPTPEFPGYESFWNLADRKGYSGTAIYSRLHPLAVTYGLGVDDLDHEGRVITLEFSDFYLLTVYTPNSGMDRLDFRGRWDEAFRQYVVGLDARKPLIMCGDFNVVHQPIDARNFDEMRGSACITDQERDAYTRLLACGFTDTFRFLYPAQEKAYSWWSYKQLSRRRNIGWRIDAFLISDRLRPLLLDAGILRSILGADHCPVTLSLRLP